MDGRREEQGSKEAGVTLPDVVPQHYGLCLGLTAQTPTMGTSSRCLQLAPIQHKTNPGPAPLGMWGHLPGAVTHPWVGSQSTQVS